MSNMLGADDHRRRRRNTGSLIEVYTATTLHLINYIKYIAQAY